METFLLLTFLWNMTLLCYIILLLASKFTYGDILLVFFFRISFSQNLKISCLLQTLTLYFYSHRLPASLIFVDVLRNVTREIVTQVKICGVE